MHGHLPPLPRSRICRLQTFWMTIATNIRLPLLLPLQGCIRPMNRHLPLLQSRIRRLHIMGMTIAANIQLLLLLLRVPIPVMGLLTIVIVIRLLLRRMNAHRHRG
jgi:hypothetical protein